jgi:hypothetical protein
MHKIKEAKLVQDSVMDQKKHQIHSPCDTGNTHRYESHLEIEILVKILDIIKTSAIFCHILPSFCPAIVPFCLAVQAQNNSAPHIVW